MINCLIPRLGLTCPDDPLPEAVLYVVYSLYAVSLIMFITIGTVVYGRERIRRNRRRPYTVKKVSDFPFSSRDVTYQTLPGRE
jgi:hypothetical protein